MHDVTRDRHPVKEEMIESKLRSGVDAAGARLSAPTMTAGVGRKVGNDKSRESSSDDADEDEDEDATEERKEDKRYIPPYKKPDAALTFPEKVRYWLFVVPCFMYGGRLKCIRPLPCPRPFSGASVLTNFAKCSA